MPRLSIWIFSSLLAANCAALAVTQFTPMADDEVLEILPSATRQRTPLSPTVAKITDPKVAVAEAREAIALARQTGDTRYWGRAQAVLLPWWDRPDAPMDMAVLQATVQQGRHEFEAARKTLIAGLARAPANAQAWLTLASLERLTARYADALVACDAVGRAGSALYAKACQLETQSLQGAHTGAIQGLNALLMQARSPEQGSWLLSLLAESEERAGQDAQAQATYKRSLALVADLYTAIAYSDLLLRTQQPAQALRVLSSLPQTDAVILRRAAAWKRSGDARWKSVRSELHERTAELVRRGDDPGLHGRELALAALWLDDDAVRATTLAKANLRLQREPLDWWVAVQSAQAARDGATLTEIAADIQRVGLSDMRLTRQFSAVGVPMPKKPK